MDSIVHFIFSIFRWVSELLVWKDNQLYERREVFPVGEVDDVPQRVTFQRLREQLNDIAGKLSERLGFDLAVMFDKDKDCVVFWSLGTGVCVEITFETYCRLPSTAIIKTELGDEEKKLFASLHHNFWNDRFEILPVFIPMN